MKDWNERMKAREQMIKNEKEIMQLVRDMESK